MEVKTLFNEHENEIVKGLYGSEIQQCKACGYCKRHSRYLTVKMLRQHDCLNKQCYHLVKNEEHKWWQEREHKKALRKARKVSIYNA